jgi:hypothetical protein
VANIREWLLELAFVRGQRLGMMSVGGWLSALKILILTPIGVLFSSTNWLRRDGRYR